MSKALDKLEELKRIAEWEGNDLELLNNWQTEINRLDLNRSYLELPTSIEIAGSAQKLIKAVENELLANRLLTDRERDYKFALRDCYSLIYKNFSLEELDKAENSIETELDDEISKVNKINEFNKNII